MFEKLHQKAAARAEEARSAVIRRIAAAAPEGVRAEGVQAEGIQVEAGPDGVTLMGRGLVLRFIRDARLRNFWR